MAPTPLTSPPRMEDGSHALEEWGVDPFKEQIKAEPPHIILQPDPVEVVFAKLHGEEDAEGGSSTKVEGLSGEAGRSEGTAPRRIGPRPEYIPSRLAGL
eukprot:249369-Prorocentrum_minimum.AAC.2